MRKVNTVILLTFMGFIAFTLPLLAGTGGAGPQPYLLDADNIYFDYQQEIVTASGKVSLEIADLAVKADTVEVDLSLRTVRASGGVELRTPRENISGRALEYNYSSNTGVMYGARTRIDDLRFQGGVIRFLSAEEYALEIEEASFTPCSNPDPHYQIKASQVLVYPEQKVVGKKVEFWLGETKIISLPGYVVEYVDTPEGRKFINPFPLPRLGYNTKKGFSLEYYYPYEYNERLKGGLRLNVNQSGERTGVLEGSYDLSPALTLKETLKYNRIFNDEEELEEEGLFRSVLEYSSGRYTSFAGIDYDYLNREILFRSGLGYRQGAFKLSGGLDYSLNNQETVIKGDLDYYNYGLELQTGIEYNLSTNSRDERLKIAYNPQSDYSLAVYQEYTDETLEKYSYSAGYNGSGYTLQLLQREGYDYDYQPYLAFSKEDFIPGPLTGGFSGGIGKVENEGVTADRLKAALDLASPLKIIPEIESELTGRALNYYYRSGSEREVYRVYQIGAGGSYQRRLGEKVDLEAGLEYSLTVNSGTPLLPDDQVDEGSYLTPSLGLTYHLPEPESAISLELTGRYSLTNRKLEEAGVKLVRSFDCYSISAEYYPVEQSFGFSIDL